MLGGYVEESGWDGQMDIVGCSVDVVLSRCNATDDYYALHLGGWPC